MSPRFLAPGFLLLGFSVFAAASPEEAVVAKVGGLEVKAGELREWFSGLDDTAAAAVKADPARLSEAVRLLLARQLVLQEAEAKDWAAQPAVAARLKRQRDAWLAEDYLRSVAQPEADFPSEENLRQAYAATSESLVVPRRFHLAQIFLAASPQAETELAAIREKLAAPRADFAAIARAHSEEPASAGNGGDLGWLPENHLQPAVRSAIENLSKGETSAPIRMEEGWHIVKVIDREEPRTLEFEEVKDRLAERLREQHVQAASREYLARLLKENPVVINEIELPAVLSQP